MSREEAEVLQFIGVIVGCVSWVSLAFGVQRVSKSKGYDDSAALWLSLGFTPIIGLLYVIARPVNQDGIDAKKLKEKLLKECTLCRELVKTRATICKHCGAQFQPSGKQPVFAAKVE